MSLLYSTLFTIHLSPVFLVSVCHLTLFKYSLIAGTGHTSQSSDPGPEDATLPVYRVTGVSEEQEEEEEEDYEDHDEVYAVWRAQGPPHFITVHQLVEVSCNQSRELLYI